MQECWESRLHSKQVCRFLRLKKVLILKKFWKLRTHDIRISEDGWHCEVMSTALLESQKPRLCLPDTC